MITYKEFRVPKERKKFLRVILQVVILLAVAAVAIHAWLFQKTYMPAYHKSSQDNGFVALSYFGVDRLDDQNLIGVKRLHSQLAALKKLGFVTITQQDILDYYRHNKPLPPKALLLMFEDGRRDTAIFAQSILEDLNFKATMLTYPENFSKKSIKFLTPNELKELQNSTYWEMGSNGYRLAFINVFDRYDNYLGELSPLQYASVRPYLGRKYNHYLMDYIRDKYGIPKESKDEMKQRIAYDYQAMRDIYTESLGYVPGLYSLMHANTGSFGNNDNVSAANAYWIEKLFQMNFNREGFCLNKKNSSIYDLTRMEPQAYWSVNHLLMRIQDDTKQDVEFVKGDLYRQDAWQIIKGALEIKNQRMILTSLPKDVGLVRLKNSNDFTNIILSVSLTGNKIGMQKIYLRADKSFNRFLSVSLFNNVFYITQKVGGAEEVLCKTDLDELDGVTPVSIAEDQKAAKVRELETFGRYAPSAQLTKVYTERLKDAVQESAPTVADGAKPYVAAININAKGNHQLSIALRDDEISVTVDGRQAVKHLKVEDTYAGSVYLESAWGGYGWSQRNLADDVYDGVFNDLMITDNSGAAKERILYDSKLKGFAAVERKLEKVWEKLMNWSMANL